MESILTGLNSSFDNVLVSKEWNVFIADLHDAVDHQLSENNIDNFHNLLVHEKSLLMNKALQSLTGGLSYEIIHNRISQALDVQINHEAERIIRLDVNPFQTRTETILTAAFEGIISILSRWPDLRSKLSKMFNVNIPNHLRPHIWKAILENSEVLVSYQRIMRTNSKNAISKYDKEISQCCERLLNNESYLFEMKGSVGCFYGMKAVLSYFHASTMENLKLTKSDYLFVIPIVYVLQNKLSLREPPTIKVMEVLVQEYFTLRHVISVDFPFIGAKDKIAKDQYRYFCQQVYKNIVTIDVTSAQSLMDHMVPSQDNIVATEMKLFDMAGEIIENLLWPIVSSIFVGYLPMESLLFVWDQYLLGFDKQSFREKYWPMITGIYLELIVRRRIINRNQSVNIILTDDLLRSEGMKLKPFDFQFQINKSFYVEVMRIIHSTNASTVDPTAESSKWKHWFDSIHHVNPISPQDRNDMRILREKEREKFNDLRMKLEAVEMDKSKMQQNLEIQANIYMSNYETVVNKYKSDTNKLKKDIEQMKNENNQANNTIQTLRDELEKTKEMIIRSSTIENLRGLVPPPVSLRSHISSRQRSPGSYENYLSDQLTTFTEDFVTQLANNYQTILHGEGKEKFELNDETMKFLNSYEEDKKEAEMELFDKVFSSEELERLDNANDRYYSQKIYQEIAKKTNDRRQKSNNLANTVDPQF